MLKSLRVMFYPLSPSFRFLPHCLTVGNNVGDNIRVLLFPLSRCLFPDLSEGSRFMQGRKEGVLVSEMSVFLCEGIFICCVPSRTASLVYVCARHGKLMTGELLDSICLVSTNVLTLLYSCLESNSIFSAFLKG